MSIKVGIYIAVAVAFLGLVAGLWFLFDQNGKLQKEIGSQIEQIKELKETVTVMQDDAKRNKENTEALMAETSKIREEIEKRKRVINRHNFGRIGSKRPKLLEDRANKGTSDLLKRLEESSK